MKNFIFLIIFLSSNLFANFIELFDTYSARGFSLGETGVSFENDISALNINPAILATLNLNSLNFTYMFLFEGMKFLSFESGIKLSKDKSKGTIGLEFSSLTVPSFPNYDKDGNELTSLEPYEYLFAIGIGKNFYNTIDTGLALKYFKTSLGLNSSSALALNTGFIYKTYLPALNDIKSKNFNLGFSVSSGLKSYKFTEENIPLPFKLRIGMSYNFLKLENLQTTLVSEIVNNSYKKKIKFATALEFFLLKYYNLRIGYIFTENYLHKLCYGIGLNEERESYNIIIDYSYIKFENFDISHIFSIRIEFGKSNKVAGVKK